MMSGMTFVENIRWADSDSAAVADDRCLLTYAELRRAASVVGGLIAEEYGRGGYLIVKATPDVPFVVTFLGTMLSGNTPIPVDPRSPAGTMEYISQKSRAAGIVEPLDFDYLSERLADADGLVDHPNPEMPAVVMFTSGTSGFPKGVMISHGNLLHACRAISQYLEYETHNSAAVVLPLYYSYALLSQLCCQLYCGGFVRLFSDLRNPLKAAVEVKKYELSTFCGVPSTFHTLSAVHRMAPLSFESVRVVCSAGAAMDYALCSTIKEMFPHATLFNNYGMTEAAPRVSYVHEDDPRFFEPTCGRPIDGVEVRVIHPESHETLPDGERGLLAVRGPNITAGYLNDEEVTRKSFTADGFLVSGDVAYIDRGYIMLCGRADDIFNVGGEKVAPLEIERVLNRLPAVERSAVRGLADAARGQIPAAFLKLRARMTRKELQARLKDELPFNKLPQRFFEVTSFPMTSNGKLIRRLLSPDDAGYVVGEIH